MRQIRQQDLLYHLLDTPFGKAVLSVSQDGIAALNLRPEKIPMETAENNPVAMEASLQLCQYFQGKRKIFTLPLAPAGTPFQLNVWKTLCTVPYGTTISYSGLAARSGHPKAARAVGGAMGCNPIPIIIPCHRVISASGSPGGFSLPFHFKIKLMDIEGITTNRKEHK